MRAGRKERAQLIRAQRGRLRLLWRDPTGAVSKFPLFLFEYFDWPGNPPLAQPRWITALGTTAQVFPLPTLQSDRGITASAYIILIIYAN